MLNIAEELKTIYRNDLLPIVMENAPKDLELYFPSLGLYILTDQILDDSFELNEKLCSEEDLVFGSCEASQIKFTVADVVEDLTGLEFTINQIVNGTYNVPLGKFKVDSCKKQDDLRFKDIIAYDAIKSTDINVADWYNGLFPNGNEIYTLKAFRTSLLTHLGILEEIQMLPNDTMIVEKTIDPTQISGREVLEATVELNGAFGHINRDGKFVRKVLQPSYGLYPSETLYPSDDLYPISETDTTYAHESIIDENVSKAMYQSVRFEEYTVREIDKLQIRAEENDIGAIVGTGTNTYVIEGNFLVFGKSAAELEQIAVNVYRNLAKRPYRPFEANSIGLPYVEVGDSLEIATDDTVIGYVFQRTLTGIQALRDTYIADGNEEREQNFGVNKELIQLQGKATRIKKDVEGVSIEVEDLERKTQANFEITDGKILQETTRSTGAEEELAGRITIESDKILQETTRSTGAEEELAGRITTTADAVAMEVTRSIGAEEELSGSISTLAGKIVLKVDADGNIATAKLEADTTTGTSFKVKADNISLEGLTTINGKFKILEDGSIEAVDGTYSGKIVGGEISGVKFSSSAWDGNAYGSWFDEVNISGGEIKLGHTYYADTGKTTEIATILRYNKISTKYVDTSNLGSSEDPVANGYFKNLTATKGDFSSLTVGGKRPSKLYVDTTSTDTSHLVFDSGQVLRFYKVGNYVCSLGNATYPWSSVYTKNLYHKGGNLGFFDMKPIAQKTVTKLSTTADNATVLAKVNELLDVIGNKSGYGLIKLIVP